MAVVTYTLTVAGGGVTINPDPAPIVFAERDYLIFNRAAGTGQDVNVQIAGGAIDGQIIIAIRGDTTRVQILPPTLDAAGNILIKFDDVGGNNDGFPP